MAHDNDDHALDLPFWRSRYAAGLVVFGGIALFFLLTKHRAHFLGALPYLLLLACPLMHLFMHHGHGNHKHDRADRSLDRDTTPKQQAKQP